ERFRSPGSQSGSREKLQHVAVGIFEIYAMAAVPGIGFHVILRHWTAAVRNSGLLDATEDGVELRVADVESIVMHIEAIPGVEIQGERFVDLDWRKMAHRAVVLQAEYPGEKLCRGLLVMRRHDRVIQRDCHNWPPSGVAPSTLTNQRAARESRSANDHISASSPSSAWTA